MPEIVRTFHCLNRLFKWSQKCCKFLAFSFEFQKFFSITRTFFFSQWVRTIFVQKSKHSPSVQCSKKKRAHLSRHLGKSRWHLTDSFNSKTNSNCSHTSNSFFLQLAGLFCFVMICFVLQTGNGSKNEWFLTLTYVHLCICECGD